MDLELSPESWKVLMAFACYLVGVAALGLFSHRFLARGSFIKEYFLGNRALGPWVLALTVAATAISGGTFMGFPSLIYTNGWIMALWIASYMVVPLTTMALLGKRINQVARISGAVTVPDVLRDRFRSPALGIVATLLILLFLSFNLVAQFKAGGLVMKEALGLRPPPATFLGARVDPDKNLVLYFMLLEEDSTTETIRQRIDTQKIPLPFESAEYFKTEVNAEEREVLVSFVVPAEPFIPPHKVKYDPESKFLGIRADLGNRLFLHFQSKQKDPDGRPQLGVLTVPPAEGTTGPPLHPAFRKADFFRALEDVENREVVLYAQLKGPQKPIQKKVTFPPEKIALPGSLAPLDKGYLFGLLIFALTVVAYTTYGGFWAVTWTDVLEGLVMLVGVVVMAVLAMRAVPPILIERAPPSNPAGSEPAATLTEEVHGLAAATERLRRQDANLVFGPGPKNYLPLGLAFSFFLMWSLMAAGQPSGMVRLMSFKDSPSLRRALLLVCGYYVVTYLSLLIIFVCARAMFPTEYLREIGSEGEPDSIMPAMARHVTRPLAGGSFVAGLLLAAPYAAIMSTVAAFLLMISSSLVRDLYQRTISPNVSPKVVKTSSYVVTGLVGVVVLVGALNPPGFLQYIIVFTGSGQGCSFLVPVCLGLYWPRATRAGMLAGMLGGFLTLFTLYALGWIDTRQQAANKEIEHKTIAVPCAQAALDRLTARRQASANLPPESGMSTLEVNLKKFLGWGEKRPDAFAPLYMGGLDPLVWGLLVSLGLGIAVSLATRPDPELVKKYFP